MKKGKLESRGRRDPWPFTANCVSDLLRDLEKSTSNSKPAFTCPWSKYKVIVTSCFQGPRVWARSSRVTHVHAGWAWLGQEARAAPRSLRRGQHPTGGPGGRRCGEASSLPPTHPVCNLTRSEASVRDLKTRRAASASMWEIRRAALP